MPGTWHEPAATTRAQVTILRGWRALRPLEPALAALHRAAGTPVTARLSWWRSMVMADHGAVPLLLTRLGPGGNVATTATKSSTDMMPPQKLCTARRTSSTLSSGAARLAKAQSA